MTTCFLSPKWRRVATMLVSKQMCFPTVCLKSTTTHLQPYMVLVVTKAVPPSSVAGSGILCSAIVLHAGKPPPTSVPPRIMRSLQAVKPFSHSEPVWLPECTWKQGDGASAALWNISAWPFLSEGRGCSLAAGCTFWRSSCLGMPSSVTQTTEKLSLNVHPERLLNHSQHYTPLISSINQ